MATAAITPEPKKSNTKLIIVILLVLGWSIDHYKFHYFSGSDEVKADSTSIVVSVPVETSTVSVVDTTKKDTAAKK